MISQKFRFHGHGSLKYVFKNGISIRSNFFIIKIVNNKKRNNYRASVVVSKKIFKSAIKRNRVRRRVYEAVRKNINPDLKIDFAVIVISQEVLDSSFNDIENKIVSAINSFTDKK